MNKFVQIPIRKLKNYVSITQIQYIPPSAIIGNFIQAFLRNEHKRTNSRMSELVLFKCKDTALETNSLKIENYLKL